MTPQPTAPARVGFIALVALACATALADAPQAPGTPAAVAAAEPHPAAPATPVATGPAGYSVELVIFRLTSSQGSPEDWAAAAALAPPAPGSGDDTDTPAATEANGRFVRTLAADELQLNDVAARLRSSGAYALVGHVGWIQNASAWGRKASMSLQQLGIDVPGLAGTVVLERGQFLHLGLALDLAVASPPTGLSAPPGATFTLHDSHRIKLAERNYYDSPAFGVIALVTSAGRVAR